LSVVRLLALLGTQSADGLEAYPEADLEVCATNAGWNNDVGGAEIVRVRVSCTRSRSRFSIVLVLFLVLALVLSLSRSFSFSFSFSRSLGVSGKEGEKES
jgi:hypothetical protein